MNNQHMNNQYIYDDIKNATRLIFDSVYGIEKTKTITENKYIIYNMANCNISIFLRNQSINLKNLEYLEFTNDFNYSIKGILPPKLKTLIFGSEFNLFFEKDDLPNTLISLTLGKNYSHMLINLPTSLTKLELVTCNENVFRTIQPSVKTLIVYGNFIHSSNCGKLMNNLPIGLEKLVINYFTIEKADLLKKIPFGCKVYNEKNEIIQSD